MKYPQQPFAKKRFFSSTTKLCVAADTLNKKPVGMKDRELFKKIQKAYMDRVEKEIGWKMY